MTPELILTTLAGIIVAGLGSSVLTACLQHKWNKRDKRSAESAAIMYCLLVCLQNEARRIISQGECTKLVYEQFTSMYKTYKAMGGDGYADALKKQVDNICESTLKEGII